MRFEEVIKYLREGKSDANRGTERTLLPMNGVVI